MNLTELKAHLQGVETIDFVLFDGTLVPAHYHLTEIGAVTKNFIDCGGTQRQENVVSLQLWVADDLEHRLTGEKFLNIITLAESRLGLKDQPIEVEYQTDTVGKYALDFDGERFVLKARQTDCLAGKACGIPAVASFDLSNMMADTGSCTPGGGCC